MAKPTLPQGTRDFSPQVVQKRTYILDTIRRVFETYGFQPLETPAMENLETLMGKYGEEGDKLIFRILNNGLGDPRNLERSRQAFENVLAGKNDKGLTERALRYDLTIPFARYVAMNHAQLAFPFKRYQIQPVWRADRPQKGRYREFYQCDADVVGSRSLLCELEFVHIYHEVFTRLCLQGYRLCINSRKILAALAEACGGRDKLTEITISIDKLDKIGIGQVKEELASRGLGEAQVAIISNYLGISGNNTDKIAQVRQLVGHLPEGAAGIAELEFLQERVGGSPAGQAFRQEKPGAEATGQNSLQEKTGVGAAGPEPQQESISAGAAGQSSLQEGTGTGTAGIPLEIDFTLARGLNYYTGIIFEVKAPAAVKIGSIGGGGRYDDLTGLFGVPGIPGAGISFGVDRIYDVMEELQLFPAGINVSTEVLLLNLGEKESQAAFGLVQSLRSRGVRAELFPDSQKIDKQFKYAEKKQIPFVGILGAEELAAKTCRIKDIRSGSVTTVGWGELDRFEFL